MAAQPSYLLSNKIEYCIVAITLNMGGGRMINTKEVKADVLGLIGFELDEEDEADMLTFINEEIAVEESDLWNYFKKLEADDIMYWLDEYVAKWNPNSNVNEVVRDEISPFSTTYVSK